MEKEKTHKRAVFTIVDCFENWLNQNTDAETICLSGEFCYNDVKFISDLLSNCSRSVRVDISELKFHHSDYEREIFNGPHVTLGWELSYIDKMILNRKYGNVFKISNNMVFSDDGRILVHVPVDREVEIPQGIEIIGCYAVKHNQTIKNLEFPDSVHIIDKCAFADCNNLESVIMHDGITELGDSCFNSCNISHLQLSHGLTEIPMLAFFNSHIAKLNIPPTIKRIGCSAFYYVRSSETIVIPEGVEEIASDALEGDYSRITLPSTLKKIAYDAFYDDYNTVFCEDFLPYVDIHPDNPVYYSENGKLYRRDTGCEALGDAGKNAKYKH